MMVMIIKYRVRHEQHMPRRHLPVSKLAIMPSSSSLMLVRLEQEMLIVEQHHLNLNWPSKLMVSLSLSLS